jgi:fermentation-respiration switch protein FrsA (DUF1100 family)
MKKTEVQSMAQIPGGDYSVLDKPEVLRFLFHPRPELGTSSSEESPERVLIPVEKDVVVAGCFHMVDETAPNILFFHGNGEIVSDYDEMGPVYNNESIGINFLPVDYRGYGRSTGTPTVSAMMRDCHVILDFVLGWLRKKAYSGPLVAMGRSLGSASVIELAARHKEVIDALIVESGFAYAAPLLRLLGIDVQSLGFVEEKGFANIDKIGLYKNPTLIIHAERDHIIPFSDGQALYEACGAKEKTLLKIPRANHNDIFMHGFSEYMGAVKTLVRGLPTL